MIQLKLGNEGHLEVVGGWRGTDREIERNDV